MSKRLRFVCAYCDCYIQYNNGVICLENVGQCPCLRHNQIRLTKKVSMELRKLRGDPVIAGNILEVIQLDRDVHLLTLLEHLELSDYTDINLVTLFGNIDHSTLTEIHAESGCYIIAERESHEAEEPIVPATSPQVTITQLDFGQQPRTEKESHEAVEPIVPETSPQVTITEQVFGQQPRNDLTVPVFPGNMPTFIPLPRNTQYKPNAQTGQNHGQRRANQI